MPRGEFHRPAAAFHRRADGNDALHPGLARPLQHRVEIRREILVVEVGVRVDQRHENRLEMMLMLRPRIARLNTKEINPCMSVNRRMRAAN